MIHEKVVEKAWSILDRFLTLHYLDENDWLTEATSAEFNSLETEIIDALIIYLQDTSNE